MILTNNNIFDKGHIVAIVNSDGTVTRIRRVRLPIKLLQQAGVRSDIIEKFREEDRQRKAARQSRVDANNQKFNFDTNRTFGVEIECFHATNRCIYSQVVSKLYELGITCLDQHRRNQYNHDNYINYWKMVFDSSIKGKYSFELVSPILQGEDGLEILKKVCSVLNELGVRTNQTCGLHVHHFANDFSADHINNVFECYKANECLIDLLMPFSRRNNDYCVTLKYINKDEWKLGRYYKINRRSLFRHGTIEFRQHNGTTDAIKIINWIKLTQQLLINPIIRRQSNLEQFLQALHIPNIYWFLERADEIA